MGAAMNLATGVFTTPRDGVYQFDFSGVKDSSGNRLLVYLRLNGAYIGAGYGSRPTPYVTAVIQSTLQLKKGDRVDLYLEHGTIEVQDYIVKATHFSGRFIEEDLKLV